MPKILEPNFDAIPEFLRQEKWAVWPAEPKTKGGFNKRPVGTSGYPIGTDKLQGWDNFNNARASYEANKGKTLHELKGPISGVGILLQSASPLVGIDFDHVINPDGTIAQWAKPFVEALKAITYCEFSPSGTGLHAYLYGKKPDTKCKGGPANQLEVYEETRFLTVTGQKLDGCQNEAGTGQEAQAILDELIAYILKSKTKISTGEKGNNRSSQRFFYPSVELNNAPIGQSVLTDKQLLDKARNSKKNKYGFIRLFDYGDISRHNSASEADLALCNYLAFWTRHDSSQMDRLMRQSALLRESDRLAKWDKIHRQGATYGEMTIEKAIADTPNVYEPQRKKSTQKQSKQNTNKQEASQQDVLPFAEDDLAVRFVAKHKGNMRFCHDSGRWYGWNGQIWKRETIQEGLDRIRIVCKEAAELAGIKERKGLLRAQLFCNVDKIARTDSTVAVTSEAWDTDKFLLGTPGGTVDLRTGKLRKAKTSDYITKSTLVAPDENTSPLLWLKFLDETTGGDKGLQRFLQQICGMVLTGDTSEHVLIFVYGPGGNGKSVFLTVLTEILADYVANAPMETFTLSHSDRHPTELAMLRGARLVTASETEEGRYWAESKIKQMTGGDPITARYLHQNFFTYRPQFKLLIIGNHKPSIRTLDDAIKRRINIIPFTQRPQKIDYHLSEKLRVEYPGILRWMVEGCLDWQGNGLQRPECVKQATEDYFADQDLISQWIDECCNTDPQFSGKSSALFSSWKEFAERNGIKPGNSKTFKSSMERRGYENKHTSTAWVFRGICLKPQEEERRYSD